MSTELKKIKGEHGPIHMTRFYGKTGISLQITQGPADFNGQEAQYIQLTRKDVIKLRRRLRTWSIENEA